MGYYQIPAIEESSVPTPPSNSFILFLNSAGAWVKKDSSGNISSLSSGLYTENGILSNERTIEMNDNSLQFNSNTESGLFFINSKEGTIRIGARLYGTSNRLSIQGTHRIDTPEFAPSNTGLNDITSGGIYTNQIDLLYQIEIDGIGPDTFKWTIDGGTTYEATGVAITGSAQTLSYGVTITFANILGHTMFDAFLFDAIANNPILCSDGYGNTAFTATNKSRVGIGVTYPDYTIHAVTELPPASIVPMIQIYNKQNTIGDMSIFAFALNDDVAPPFENETVYACISGEISDPTSGSATGDFKIKVSQSGTITEIVTVHGDDGRVSMDNALIVGGGSIDASAQLEIQTGGPPYKGFLPPKITTANKGLIAAPATGLLVYDTDLNSLSNWDGVSWVTVGGISTNLYSSDGTLTGARDVDMDSNALGFTNASAGVSIGTATAATSAILDLDVSSLPNGGKKGLLVPRMTTNQMNFMPFPTEGLIIYDTQAGEWKGFNGLNWITIA